MKSPASALRREIKQGRPFPSAGQETAVALLRTAAVLRTDIERALEPFGVTDQQYNVLRILRGAGKDGLPTLAIAERMIERAPGITRLIDRLEKKGLVSRKRCTSDRRQVFCILAPAGARLLSRMDAPVSRCDEDFGVLGDADLKTLIRLLDAVRAGLSHPSKSSRRKA